MGIQDEPARACSVCTIPKPSSLFAYKNKSKGQRRSICKKCDSEAHQHRRSENKDKYRDIDRRSKLRWVYGISEEKYLELLEKQKGVCPGCLKPCKVNKRLSVDHCHKTKKVRGLLCAKCNQALGFVQDDPEILERLAAYLRSQS